jgi:preprotein translocase subunit SecY
MLNAIVNIFKVPELRNKVIFTIAMLIVYRLGHAIPLPGVNAEKLREMADLASQDGDNIFSRATQAVAMFSGGSLSHSTIFGLGVMPYITASIIFQLLSTVYPKLKKIQEEGPTGRQKVMEWTRYATVILSIIQGVGWLSYIRSQGLLYPGVTDTIGWWVMGITLLTAGTVFLMWLGEQIDKFGIGNGISMIIAAGILVGMPGAVKYVYDNYQPGVEGKIAPVGVAFIVVGFVVVIAGSVLLTIAQRRIPIQMAKHSRSQQAQAGGGRNVVGGERSFLPLKVNHSGVMPVVFASSLMIFPSILFGMLAQPLQNMELSSTWSWAAPVTQWLTDNFQMGRFPYIVGEVILIYFFAYFWITIQFSPEDMSKQLRDTGSFIPGIRPGPRTAEYLETVMGRITYVGAAFLAIIAILPMVISSYFNIPFQVSQFLGGTGLLIVVSVVLDFMQRVEANLLMRNYEGFLGAQGSDGGPRLRSRFATNE